MILIPALIRQNTMAITNVNPKFAVRNAMSVLDYKAAYSVQSFTLESWAKANGVEKFAFLSDGEWIAGSEAAIAAASAHCPASELQVIEITKDGTNWFKLVTLVSKAEQHHTVASF